MAANMNFGEIAGVAFSDWRSHRTVLAGILFHIKHIDRGVRLVCEEKLHIDPLFVCFFDNFKVK